MSETNRNGTGGPAGDVSDAISGRDPQKSAFLIYILYLVGIAIPILPLVAVVLAYLFRGNASGWLQTHYVYLIRTFWIGLLYSILSIVLMVVLIGWLVSIAVVVWLVVRCVKGMQHLSKREAVPDPQTWLV
ncbi:DUF4870 family protein [Lutibaculum baratangense]|uniref:Transmembrane protein n=1 Tax=Lutibaculum baratangense AMV1 TaxID=631454 RepID=V4RP80_9HYPH|nr:hypothetical protein [Lutibaculum baratangense]ESR27079.1 hypothetical protein N177_0347 [Lutibaculum baratangense AMV1]